MDFLSKMRKLNSRLLFATNKIKSRLNSTRTFETETLKNYWNKPQQLQISTKNDLFSGILNPPRQFSSLSPGNGRHCVLLQANDVDSSNCACWRFPSRGSILYGSKSSRSLWTTNYSDSCLKNSKIRFEAPLLTRGYGTKNASESEKVTLLPSIMNIPHITWPRLKSLSDWLFSRMTIGSRLDLEFNLKEFLQGAQMAVILISDKLSKEEYEGLEELIEPFALQEIKKNMANFNNAQLKVLKVDPNKDKILSYPYEIKLYHLDSVAPCVEITAVFLVLREDEEGQSKTHSQSVDERNRVMICNYRFYKYFIEFQNTPWIVSAVNHFKEEK